VEQDYQKDGKLGAVRKKYRQLSPEHFQGDEMVLLQVQLGAHQADQEKLPG